MPLAVPSVTPPPELRRIGVEIELLAPPGRSRVDLAHAIAAQDTTPVANRCRRFFNLDSERSRIPDRQVFYQLNRGIAVVADDGSLRCRLVDDITIDVPPPDGDQPDDDVHPSEPDYRIIADDARLLQLIARNASPSAPVETVLDPIGTLFGTATQLLPRGRYRLNDRTGASIAMAIPGVEGRERVCEIVTQVIEADHHPALEQLLAPARALGLVVPPEAAVHVHFDAEPFRDAARLWRIVEYFNTNRDELWATFDTNTACKRLGPAPDELLALLAEAAGAGQSWPEVEKGLRGLKLSKYVDLNLVNLTKRTPGKDTVEVRILAPGIEAATIVDQVEQLWSILTELW